MTAPQSAASVTGPRRFNLDRWGAIMLVALSIITPAFDQDDVAFFNYLNNVIGARPVFYHPDYVPLVPELVAYALKGLPFIAQAVLYRVLPLCVMLVLYRELLGLLRLRGNRDDASVLALAIMLILRAVEVLIWANLVFVITPMFLAAALHILRVGAEGRRYSPWAMAAILLAAMSVPFGGLLVPLLLAQLPGTADPVRRWQNAGLSVAVATGYLLLNAHVLGTSVNLLQPGATLASFLRGFRSEFRVHNVLVTLSSAVLVAALVDDWRRRDGSSRLITACLAVLGLGASLGVLVSDRLAYGDGGFGAAHVLPVLLAALIVISRAVLTVADRPRRALLVGFCAGVAAMAIIIEVSPRLRGPLEVTLMKYRFVMVAEAFRRNCRDGDAMVFEQEDTSPVVLCRPQDLPVGRHLQSQFPPAVGSRDPGALPDEQPVIVVGRPLF